MPSSPTVTTAAPAPFAETTEIADGVHAYVQAPGGWCLNNAGIIVSGGESALVDTAATEARARHLRGTALRHNPQAAPRAVVNTHFHGDHVFGNHLFPEAVVIGHERTRTEMIASGLHLTGLWPDVEWGTIELAPPTLTYTDALTLHIGSLRAELEHIGPAHTSNDTVVWLPRQRVLFTGDLVMNGVTPFCLMGSIAGSLEALERLRATGRGPSYPGTGRCAGPRCSTPSRAICGWCSASPPTDGGPAARRSRPPATPRSARTPGCWTPNGWCPTCTGPTPSWTARPRPPRCPARSCRRRSAR